jgi:hypothetical protein
MALTHVEQSMVRNELARGSDVVSIARSLGCSIREVREVAITLMPPITPAAPTGPDWGREELQQFAVAKKRPQDPWPALPAIQRAQQDYDAGLVEMATARARTVHGPMLILYVIPRRVQITRQAYFARDFNAG